VERSGGDQRKEKKKEKKKEKRKKMIGQGKKRLFPFSENASPKVGFSRTFFSTLLAAPSLKHTL